MITIIKAIQQVTGSEIILAGSLLCIMSFIFVFLLFKSNRNKKAITIYLIALFMLFEICDIIWLSYFFPKGEYINRGLVPIGIFLIFPLGGLLLNTFSTVFNVSKARTKEQ